MQLMVAPTKSEEFASRLNLLLDAMNVPPINVGRARWFHDYVKNTLKIDVTYEASRKWLSGNAIPYTKRIGVIAKGLNSTTEYLIGESQNVNFNHVRKQGVKEERAHYSHEDVELLNKVHQLSSADRARLSGIISALNPKLGKKTGS